jgi:hypothetical protein
VGRLALKGSRLWHVVQTRRLINTNLNARPVTGRVPNGRCALRDAMFGLPTFTWQFELFRFITMRKEIDYG